MNSSSVKLVLACLWYSIAWAAPDYPASTQGIPFSKDEAWYRQCMRVARRSAPAPSKARPAPARCVANDLYYQKRSHSATSPGEWRTVFECASAQQDSAVLMMLYANGFGVPRNTDIALHYACSLQHAARAEMEGRVEHLLQLPKHGAVFDQCDDITSGYMGAQCASMQESQAQRLREARLDRLERTLPASARAAFRRLRTAAAAYAGAALFEIDMRGTAAQGFAIEHEGRLRAQFVGAALDVVAKKTMPGTPAEAVALDGALNAAYRKLMTSPPTQAAQPGRLGDSTIERGTVRDVERRWLAYRDAFIAFASALPAAPGPDAIKVLLTGQRIAELNALVSDLP